MGPSLDLTRSELQQRLCTVQRLDLCLLVDREDNSLVGRIEVEADDVLDLLSELRIVADLEALEAMRLQIRSRPNALDLSLADTGVPGHQAKTPVCRLSRNLFDRHLQNLLRFARRECPRPPRPREILDSKNPLLLVASTPSVDSCSRHTGLVGNPFSCLSITEQQNDSCSVNELPWGVPCSEKCFEMNTIRSRDFELLAGSSHALKISTRESFWNGTFEA